MRHKCRYGGYNNALIASIHTTKIEETCFIVFIVLRKKQPKLRDTAVGMGGSKTRTD